MATATHVGPLLRDWRLRRHLSQLDLALDAGVSPRHISFVETGRSKPSADMVLHLAEQLEVPLRERNQLLLAAGYAPVYGQRGLEDPELDGVRDVLERVLRGHEPYPAVVIDRHWGLICANAPVALLTAGVAPELLEPPVNVLRLSLSPAGMAPMILNFAQWRAHLLATLRRQATVSGDPALGALLSELAGEEDPPATPTDAGTIAVPLQLQTEHGVLSFLSTRTVFETAVDVTVSELAIESFFPADSETAAMLGELAA